MKGKTIILLILFIFISSNIYSASTSSSINFLSRNHADTLYCNINGDCTLTNLVVLNQTTMANVTVTNYNITDELYSYGNVYFYNYLDCERLTTVNGLLVCDDMGEYLINGTDKTVHFGKVGIGTSIPTSELHVIGDINATGNIYGNDVCETSIGNYCLSDLADYSLTSTIQTWFSDNRTYSDLTYQRKDDTATNLSNYWKLDGSSIATGNWNISPYTIESPIVYTNQTCYTPDCSSRIYYNGTGMIIEG